MGWFDSIPAKYRALAALATAFIVGVMAAITLMGFVRLPDRVTRLEHQVNAQVDSMTGPNIARIEALERQVESLPEIRAMVFELWCGQFPERCRATPRVNE